MDFFFGRQFAYAPSAHWAHIRCDPRPLRTRAQMLVLEKTPQTRHGPFWMSAEILCLSTHSESFGVIRWPECDCVCAGVGLSGGRGRLLTHVHRASACTLNAVGLLPVSGRGDARVAPPCPTTLCVWRRLPYLTCTERERPVTKPPVPVR